MKTVKFKVKGMHCKTCETVIEKQVLKINGVKSCKADYARQMVTVSFDSGRTSLEKIKEKIEEKQYECDSSACKNDTPGSGSVPGKRSYLKPAILTLALVAILFGGYQFVQGFASFELPAI